MKVHRMHRSFTRRLRGIHDKPAKAANLRAEKQNEPSDRTAAGAADAGRPEAAGRGEPPGAGR